MARWKVLTFLCNSASVLILGLSTPAAAEEEQAYEQCSGIADPPYSTPYCYSTRILGEKITVKVTSLQAEKGTMDVTATGIVKVKCTGEPFKKSGQALSGNWTDCVHRSLPNLTVAYCSDQDTLLIEGRVAGANRKVNLKKQKCPSETEMLSDAEAPTCTGSGDPPSTAPFCYSGGELGEKVTLKVTSFQNEKGTVDVFGSGLEPISCSGKQFTKQGQTLSGDWTDCVKDPIKILSLQYCSDQDQVLVNSQVGPVPAAVPLAKAACPSSVVVV